MEIVHLASHITYINENNSNRKTDLSRRLIWFYYCCIQNCINTSWHMEKM